MSLVLVADDEPAVLEVLSEVVLDLGHEVLRAYDGREALQLARSQLPHLVVTDHMMPRLSGADLCRQLRREDALRDVPVILLSAALTEGIPEAQAFLPKPFELSEFEALVRRTLLEAPPRELRREGAGGEARASQDVLVTQLADGLRTPLSSARGHLSQLRRTLQHGADPRPLEALSHELAAMEQMVQALLDASHLAEGRLQLQRERADLASLLRRAVADWQERQPDCTFALSLPGGAVEASFDVARMRQVLDALLVHAVRSTGMRRRVEVELSASPAVATISVTDFGPGLSAPQRRALLEDAPEGEPWGGPGLGLVVAGQLARLHGGALSVRSEAGEGSAFTVLLPRQG